MGVAPIPGLDGGESTFVGGDAHRHLRRPARRPTQAWDFLSWTTSDEAQVEVIAKNKGVPDPHRPRRRTSTPPPTRAS